MTYQLTVQKVEQTCLFTLTWGRGQKLHATVPYPPILDRVYRQWQRAYLDFYQQSDQPALRGRPGAVGQVIAQTVDRHSQLVQAEARLLSEFHRWLRHGELYEIRRCLGQRPTPDPGDLFLTCYPLALARLPWEAWEIGTEFGRAPVHILRTPMRMQGAPPTPRRRYRARVLVILGDDTGIGLSGDRQALDSLSHLVDVTIIGWTPGQDTVALKRAICEAIADPIGWDVLFFAGHSNEADLVDGVIYVAPKTALSIRELTPSLETAQAQGLQFALFNSCSGLNIADALVNLGLSQVAVMREPIHNAVALVFVRQFLQALARHEHVQAALATACRHLKLDQQITYPSAYLIPSLFRHPDSVPFRIEPRSWRQVLGRWLPGRRQAAALAAVAVLSVVPTVRESLLSGRLLAQAMYRNLTGQLPTAPPPVVLVQIDDASIRQSPLLNPPTPISQQYLADLVTVLGEAEAPVIGIDYWLDRQQPEQSISLARAVKTTIDRSQAWLVFGAVLENQQEVGVNPASEVFDPNWAMVGYTNTPESYLALPWDHPPCAQTCPFAYLLALIARYETQNPIVYPTLENNRPLRPALLSALWPSQDPVLQQLQQVRIHPVTAMSGILRQRWLRPIVDYSLPPDQVFVRISAYELLEGKYETHWSQLEQAQVVLIGGVDYVEGGVELRDTDLDYNPPAIAYWRQRRRDNSQSDYFAGVERIAYNVHHFLHTHLIIPVPNLWMVGVATILGASLRLSVITPSISRSRGLQYLALGTAGYGLICLQSMIWSPVLLPWLLPSATVWIYLLPTLWRPSR
ncbi:MAG: CHASE2 domain-containing protein [Cyanobacteria bacterium]|nr:CHASE2 domain-containing protein [Cyanobacteriota bacterium]